MCSLSEAIVYIHSSLEVMLALASVSEASSDYRHLKRYQFVRLTSLDRISAGMKISSRDEDFLSLASLVASDPHISRATSRIDTGS